MMKPYLGLQREESTTIFSDLRYVRSIRNKMCQNQAVLVRFILGCFLLALLLIIQPVAAENEEIQHIAESNVLEVYVRDGCPHCAKAKEFLHKFSSERPWLQIVYRSVDHDTNARDELMRYSQAVGIWPPGVPTFQFNGQLVVGFDSTEHTGSLLTALVEQAEIDLNLVETSLFGTISVSSLGLPLFTLAIGLLDGFNPNIARKEVEIPF